MKKQTNLKKGKKAVTTKKNTKKTTPEIPKGSDGADYVPMLVDPSLPQGWIRKVVQRQSGKSAGKFDVYLYTPDKKKLRSRTELAIYLKGVKSNHRVDDFDFTIRGRENSPVKKPNAPAKSPERKQENGDAKSRKTPETKSKIYKKSDIATITKEIKRNKAPKLVVKLKNFSIEKMKEKENELKQNKAAENETLTAPQEKVQNAKKKATKYKGKAKGKTQKAAAETSEPEVTMEKSTRASKRKETEASNAVPPKKKKHLRIEATKNDTSNEESKNSENAEEGGTSNSNNNNNKDGGKKKTNKKAAKNNNNSATGTDNNSENKTNEPLPGPSGITNKEESGTEPNTDEGKENSKR